MIILVLLLLSPFLLQSFFLLYIPKFLLYIIPFSSSLPPLPPPLAALSSTHRPAAHCVAPACQHSDSHVGHCDSQHLSAWCCLCITTCLSCPNTTHVSSVASFMSSPTSNLAISSATFFYWEWALSFSCSCLTVHCFGEWKKYTLFKIQSLNKENLHRLITSVFGWRQENSPSFAVESQFIAWTSWRLKTICLILKLIP